MEKSLQPLRVAICEDLPGDVAQLSRYIEDSGPPAECKRFKSGEAFLAAFCVGRYDLVFLDIYMGGITGIKVAEEVREADRNVLLAFTTASLDHTLESYRLGAVKYLEKPVRKEDVRETLELADTKRRARSVIALTAEGGRSTELPLDGILYFEQRGHVVEVHTVSGMLRTSQSARLDEIEKCLPSPPFLRCHRSYIVNLDYVRRASRETNAFQMKNGDRADIRRGGFTGCEEALKLWMLEKTGRDGP